MQTQFFSEKKITPKNLNSQNTQHTLNPKYRLFPVTLPSYTKAKSSPAKYAYTIPEGHNSRIRCDRALTERVYDNTRLEAGNTARSGR